jgi:MscS family membrane protein
LTRDFNEFAEVREELLLNIMAYVEDSGTNLASPSQTLYLRPDPGSTKQKSDAVDKKAAPASDKSQVHSSAGGDKNAESNRDSADRARLESALRNQTQDDGRNFKKDD